MLAEGEVGYLLSNRLKKKMHLQYVIKVLQIKKVSLAKKQGL